MTHPMAERDAVVTAGQELIEAALSGHGTALFVIGAAGLGKTTMLEHAVAVASGRFRAAVGRADIGWRRWLASRSWSPWPRPGSRTA